MGLETATIAWISTGLGAASSVVSYMDGKAYADEQEQQQEEYNKALLQNTVHQYQELDEEEGKAIYDAHTKSIGAQKKFMQARSEAIVQAGASGVAGKSIDVAVENLRTGLGGNMADILYEQEARLNSINTQAENVSRGYTSSYDNKRISQPSMFGALEKGINTGASAFTGISGVSKAYKSIQTAIPTTIRRGDSIGGIRW